MPANRTARRWTATVTVAGMDITELLELPASNDTLIDTERAAKTLAARMIRDEYGTDASVIIFKQLAKDPAPVRDRSHYVYREDDGSIRSQYMGA